MPLSGLIILAGITSFAFIYMAHKRLDMKLIAGYDSLADIGASLIVLAFFGGSFDGLMIGAITGLLISFYLTWFKKHRGYSRYVVEDGDETDILGMWKLPTKKFRRVDYPPVK